MKTRFTLLKGMILAAMIAVTFTAGSGRSVSAQSEENNDQPNIFLPLITENAGSQPPATDAEYEYIIIEDDIQVAPDYFEIQVSNVDTTYHTNLWPNGIVPFEFDANVTIANQQAMLAAMAEWEGVATVDFRQCMNNLCGGDHIRIRNASVNNSWVGRLGGEQIINIFNWNLRFVMVHELAHALGYWHEQSRADRDTFVRINWANIVDAQESNFQIRFDGGEYGPYDFDSVMHYDQCAFAINCNGGTSPSITVLAPNQQWQTQIGQLTHLSTMDALTMSFLYPQPNWRFANSLYTGGQTGTFLAPYQQFPIGVDNTPAGGTLWVQPGRYSAVRVYGKPMTMRAPLGGVTLGQ